MNEKLLELIMWGESETLEFKPSLSDLNRIVEVACSFANKRGGTLLIGVSDKMGTKAAERILGIQAGKDTIEKITNKITDNTDFPLYPTITVEKAEDKNIIRIDVKKSNKRPHTAFHRPFTRVGNTTKLMDKAEYEELLLKRKKDDYDIRPIEEAYYGDISEKALDEYRKKYEFLNKKRIYASNEELLKTLHCVDKNLKPTLAGILLFGKDPQKFLIKSYITIVRYPDTKVTDRHIDSKDLYGNLFEQVDGADAYIREHLQVVSKIPKLGLKREDMPVYPYFAVRELIVNAVAHRDYSLYGSRILISMFKDRIEFFSPGSFPDGVTPENIVSAQFSRNPVIARVFHDVEYIEEYGNGIDRLLEEVKNHPLKPKMPRFVDIKSAVIATLYKPDVEKFKLEALGLNERQKKSLEYVEKYGKIDNKTHQTLCNATKSTATRDLQELTEKGLLTKIGKKGRGTYYVVSQL
ncbi:MAG: RNA-binding domain-containing protein [archaeon]